MLNAGFFTVLGLAAVWNGFAFPLAVHLWPQVERAAGRMLGQGLDRFDPIVLVMLFPLAGLIQIPGVVRAWRRWRVARMVRLSLDPYPGSIGGQVGGSITLPVHFQAGMRATVWLNCIAVSRRPSGRESGRSRWEKVQWRTEAATRVSPAAQGARLDFVADVADGLPASDVANDGDHTYWALRIRVGDIDQTFDIPVFATGDRQRSAIRIPGNIRREASVHTLPPEVVLIEHTTAGEMLTFPAGRERRPGIAFTIVGLVFAGVAVFMGATLFAEINSQRPSYFAMMVVGMIASGFTGFALLLVLGGVFTLTNRLCTLIGSDAVITTRRAFGRDFVRLIPFADIHHLEKKVNGQAGQGATADIYYAIQAVMKDGRKFNLSDGIPGHGSAGILETFLAERIPLAPDAPAIIVPPAPAWFPYVGIALKAVGTLVMVLTILAFAIDFMRL